jgi:hypothetical protein
MIEFVIEHKEFFKLVGFILGFGVCMFIFFFDTRI